MLRRLLVFPIVFPWAIIYMGLQSLFWLISGEKELIFEHINEQVDRLVRWTEETEG